MKTNVRWKQIGEGGNFSIKKNKTLPIFTMQDALIGQERTFLENGKVVGKPVRAQIIIEKNGTFVPFREVKGLLVEEKGGVYILPFSMVHEPNSNASGDIDTLLNDTTAVVDDVVTDVDELGKAVVEQSKKFDPKEKLGFSYRQLLVIGVIALIVFKIKK